MKRMRWTFTTALALVFALSAAAFAAKAPPPVQTPLSPTKIPQFVQPLDTLLNGLPVALGSTSPSTSARPSRRSSRPGHLWSARCRASPR